jgi:TatD DNase family protein
MRIVDSHCHLDFEGLANRLPEVLERAAAAGVGTMLTISTRVRQVQRLLAIVEKYPNIYCSIGTHPHNAHEELDVTVEELIAIAQHPKVVAIGEAGLDYHYDLSPRAAQEQGFRLHIAAARESGLPLVIHSREAEEDTARILEEEMALGRFQLLLHCFTSRPELARRGVEIGAYVSFSGILTYRNAADLRETAKAVPEERLLVETDAPYLAPVPHRGRPNEPAFVVHTLASLAEARGRSMTEMAAITSANFFRLFAKAQSPEGKGPGP